MTRGSALSLPTKLVLTGFGLTLLAVGVVAAVFFRSAEQERMTLEQARERVELRVVELERRIAEHQKVIERLHHDPVYVERTVRSRLGYARPGELVFRFKDD